MKKLMTIALVLSVQSAFSAPVVSSWVNPECASGDCEVKALRLYVEKHNNVQDRMAGNSVAIEIETSSPEHVKKYAVVQYIKGCVVLLSNLGEARVGSREFFGESGQPFKHTSWEIDSGNDKDPIYMSNPKAGFDEIRGFEIPRTSGYVNDNPALTENFGAWAGKLSNLKTNKIYATDFPTPSYWESKNGIVSARTSSLQFKVCLHKVSDIPVTVADPKTQVDAPLACLDWSSNYQLDFAKKVWIERTSLHSACR